ncbi:MAG: hypothetical protein WEF53_12425 [Bacteroidota bacterium]
MNKDNIRLVLEALIAVMLFYIGYQLTGEGPKWPPPKMGPAIQQIYDEMPVWDNTRTLADRINYGLCENAYLSTYVVKSLQDMTARQDSMMVMMMGKRKP